MDLSPRALSELKRLNHQLKPELDCPRGAAAYQKTTMKRNLVLAFLSTRH